MSKLPEMSPDDTEMAAEFALRVLPADAHRAAAVRAATDPDFAAEVRAWENRLIPLMDDILPVTPHPDTNEALMQRLFGVDEDKQGLFGDIGLWKGITALALAAAAAMAVIAFVPAADTAARYVAELATDDDATRMYALYDGKTGALQISWTARDARESDRVLELWGIVDGNEPVSIGVLPEGATASLDLPVELMADIANLVFAISDEPAGGSPTGLPTGDVIATAPATAL